MMPAGRGQAARLLRLLILCAAGGWVLGAGGGEEEVRAMVGEVCGLILSDETPPGATAGGGAAWVGPTGRGDMQRRCRVTMHRLKLMPPRGALGAGSKGMKLPNWGMPGCEVERKFSGGKRDACSAADALRLFAESSRTRLGSQSGGALVLHTVGDAMDWQHFSTTAALACPAKCLWVGSVEAPASADVQVFDCLQPPPQHTPGHPRPATLLLCLESEANVPKLRDPNFLRRFDIVATYRLSAHVPLTYAPGNLSLYAYGSRRLSERPEPGHDTGLMVWIASNCAPGRTDFVRKLMQVMRIDSYGKCLHNKDFPLEKEEVFGSEKIPLLSRYKFVLSLENSFAEDYVTEKLFQPLIAGSVPVYLGAPNIGAFVPSPDSFVDISRFETAEALAAHLIALGNDKEAYARKHAWRHQPLPDPFIKISQQGFNQGEHYGERDMRQDPCRLCSAAHRAVKDAAG